jgi:hypothetical protein
MAKPKKRYSKTQIQKRRIEVWEMHVCGAPVYEIAQKQNVTENTIRRDIKWWEEHLGGDTAKLKDPTFAAIDVGMSAAKLQKAAEDAYVEFLSCANAGFKARFLQVFVMSVTARTKLLAEHGFLPKVGHEVPHHDSVKVTFEARFGAGSAQAVFDDPKSCRKILDAAEAAIKESARSGVPVKSLLEDSKRGENSGDS